MSDLIKDRIDFKTLMASLQKLIRSRGLTYAKLAAGLGMSESGIKKIFRAKDCSLQKLASICDILEVSLPDLLIHSKDAEFSDVSFTEKQQRYLMAHRESFRVFWKLTYERMTVSEVEKNMGISSRESFQILKKLDEMGLVELHPQGRVRVPKLKRVRGFGDGPLIRELYREWSIELMKDVAKPVSKEGEQFIIRYLKVSSSTYADLLRAIKALEVDFVRRAIREMSMGSSDLISMRWVSAIDKNTFVP